MFKRKLIRLFTIAFERSGLYKYSAVRKMYYDLRVKDIDDQWGRSTGDYDILRGLISSITVNRILDIGCGSGRLFPLYNSMGIKEVIGQDIANSALDLAKARYNYSNIKLLVNLPVEVLDFPKSYFDLVISNRVLQHIPQNSIESTIETVCRLGKFVYINELSDTDGVSSGSYVFKHDYMRLFGIFGFTVKNKGLKGKQTWLLFGK